MTNRDDPIRVGLRVQLPWETDAGTERREATVTGYGGPLVRVEVSGQQWYRHAEKIREQLSVAHA